MKICSLSIALVCFLASVSGSPACKVPVFRYALERWDADPYRLIVVHRKSLPEGLDAKLRQLDKDIGAGAAHGNFDLEVIDVDTLTDAERWQLPGLEKVEDFPSVLLFPPASTGSHDALLMEAATPGTIDAILDSPVRRACVGHLLRGASAVWLLMESGNAANDIAAYEMTGRALRTAEETISLPEGVIQADNVDEAGPNVDLDDVLRSSIPLKIEFPVVRMKAGDPAEAAFRKMLLAGLPYDPDQDEPVLVPIFGRGRSAGAMPVGQIDENAIVNASNYICGECSCQIKSQNPGYDLLVMADWNKHLRAGLIVVEKELPPLTNPVSDLLEDSRSGDPAPMDESPPTAEKQGASKVRALSLMIVTGVLLLLVLVAGTLVMIRKPR